MKLWEKIKGAYKAWLQKMAEDNRKHFGRKKLDCCDMLNKKKNY